MDLNKKVVSQIPLTNLWTDSEVLNARRGDFLTTEDIQTLLKSTPVRFAVAAVGQKLAWIEESETFGFWKSIAKGNIVDNFDKIELEKFLKRFAFVASKWTGRFQGTIILLEKFH